MKHLEDMGRSLIARFKKSFSKKTKKQFFVVLSILGVVAIGALLIDVHPIFAQTQNADPFDRFLGWLAQLAVSVAGVIGQLIVFILDALTIPLMSYNGFSTSGVVGAGWSIVRDVVNMFFVIVLIAIAFGTIFGNSRFQWQQQVPRLLLFAILINFSRTISGLMIDAAQVFMFTFVNAFKDIAGGNFVQLFGLTNIVKVSETSSKVVDAANGTGSGFNAFDLFGAGIMSVLMMVIVAATVVALTVIMAWRIVMLWVLIIVSPLTWFMGGVKGIVNTADSVYADWWKQFVCYISIGPVLAFFLWLTLAVAGAGNIAASEGFTQAGQVEVAGQQAAILKIFELEHITAFVIGIAMLFAGFRAAQSVCSGLSEGVLPAILGKAEGFAKGAVKSTIKAPGTALSAAGRGAGKLGLAAGKKGAQFANNQFGITAGLKGAAGEAVGKIGSSVGVNIGGVLGRTIQTQSAVASSKLSGAASAEQYERSGAKDVLAAGPDVAADRLRMLLDNKDNLTNKEKTEASALLSDSLSNADLKKDLTKSGHFDAAYTAFGGKGGAEDLFAGDNARNKALKEFKKTRPDLNTALLSDPAALAAEYTEWEDIEKLDASVLALPEIQKMLQSVKTKFKDKNGDPLNAYQAIMDNKSTNAKREALQSALPETSEIVSDVNHDSTSGKFKPGQEHLKDVVSSKIKNDIEELGQISQDVLLKNGDVSVAAQQSINSNALASLFRKYEDAAKTGNTARQFELQNTIDNARIVVEQAAKTGGKEQEQLLKLFKKNSKAVSGRGISAVDVHNVDQTNKIKAGFVGKLEAVNNKNTTLSSNYKDKQSASGKKNQKLVNDEIKAFNEANERVKDAISKAITAGNSFNKAELEKIQKDLIKEQKTFSSSKAKNERPDAATVRAEIEAETKQAVKTINGMIEHINQAMGSVPPTPPTP